MAEAIVNQTTAQNATPATSVATDKGVSATNVGNTTSTTPSMLTETPGQGVPSQAQVTNVPASLGYSQQQPVSQPNTAQETPVQSTARDLPKELGYEKESRNLPKELGYNNGTRDLPGELGYGKGSNTPGQDKTSVTGQKNGEFNVPGGSTMALPQSTEGVEANLAQQQAEAQTSKNISDTLMDIAGKMDSFLQQSTSAYQSIIDEFKLYADASSENIRSSMDKVIASLEQKEQYYQQSMNESVAREEARLDRMLSVSEQKKDNLLKQNELAKAQTDAIWEQRQTLAEDNNSRYLGYLNAKLSVNGFAKGSAGLLSIGKYIAASEIALNEIARERNNAIATYTAKGEEIMNAYFDEVYEAEYNSANKISEIQFKMNDAIFDIAIQKTQTEAQKNAQILEVTKEYNAMQLQVQARKDELVMQTMQQKMQQLQLSHQVTMDYLQNTRADKTLDWQISTDQRNYERGIIESDRAFDFEKSNRVFDEAMAVNKFNEDVRQFGLEYALQELSFREGQRQFDKTFDFNENQAAIKTQLEDKEWRMEMVARGLMDKGSLNQYFNPQDVIMSSTYVGKDGTVENLGERVASVFDSVADKVKKLGNDYQCVQFVRDIIPDLPFGLTTLADKIRVLTKGKGSVSSPRPGATVVLDWGAGTNPNEKWGHVALVTNVSPDGKTFDIVQYNAPRQGEKSTQTIRTDDASIKGYWMSNNVGMVQPKAATNNSKVIEGIGSGLQGAVDAVVRKASTNAQAASDLQSLREYAAKGDEAGFNAYLNNAAVANMGETTKRDYTLWNNISGDANRFLESVPNIDTASGPYKKLLESTKPWVGMDKDPEFMSISGLAGLTSQAYRLMNMGTNVTVTEDAATADFIPKPTDTFKELYVKMENLRRFADVNANRLVDLEKGLDGSKTTSKYDYVKVRTKDTGEELYMERDAYEREKKDLELIK